MLLFRINIAYQRAMMTHHFSHLTIGISCLYDTLPAVLNNVSLKRLPYPKLVVVQTGNTQVSTEAQRAIQDAASEKQIHFIWQDGCGLSRSRNALLDSCRTPYLMLGDDDTSFQADGIAAALEYLMDHADIALLSGKCTQSGHSDHKVYAKEPFEHTRWSINDIASIEMILNLADIPSTVRFHTSFGLGAPFPMGEETLFASELIKQRKRAIYAPFMLQHHDGPSTGYCRDASFYYTRGALARKISGIAGLFRLFYQLQNQRSKSSLPLQTIWKEALRGFMHAGAVS